MTPKPNTLTLPDGTPLTILPPGSSFSDPTLGGFLGGFLNIVLLIALVLMFIWMVWGIFQYIFAGGDKERLAKARSRLTWTIVGFSVVIIAFIIQRYVKDIFPPNPATPVTPISVPPPITK